jgi:hypothetical protein
LAREGEARSATTWYAPCYSEVGNTARAPLAGGIGELGCFVTMSESTSAGQRAAKAHMIVDRPSILRPPGFDRSAETFNALLGNLRRLAQGFTASAAASP